MYLSESGLEASSCCSQGHRSSLIVDTICLACLSNLISNPNSPTVHVSYALSQLSHAISEPRFLQNLLTFHPHFLISPLLTTLFSFNDHPIAQQTINLISHISTSVYAHHSVYAQFLDRILDRLSSAALPWTPPHLYTLHCLGILLDCQKENPCAHIKDKDALIFNLVTGLQLPSEEIRGEIMFVLYRLSVLEYAYKDNDRTDVLFTYRHKLLHLALQALMKTQSDDVRLNCVALLSVLAQRGFFETAFANDVNRKDPFEADNFMETTEHVLDEPPLNHLLVEAIKAPLLSSDSQVQIGTLEFISHLLSREGGSGKGVQVLVQENIADYVFEILRLSGCKDPVVNSCLQVLDLLSTAEQAFRQRLAVGFTTLLTVLRYVAEVPFHPVQPQTLKLICNCVSNCPGIVSTSHIEEMGLILTGMLKKHIDGDTGMLPETFILACSILVALMKSPSSHGTSSFATSVREALRHAVLACLSLSGKDSSQFLHCLHLLKEAYSYSYSYSLEGNENRTNSIYIELRNCVLDVCKSRLFPWFVMAINEMEEDIALGILEIFHSILLQASDIEPKEFANILVSSFWFSCLFGCLGLFPTEKMKWRVYLMFSSIVDVLQENESGQVIRDAAYHLPSDPVDLLFLLGQKSSHDLELFSCQSAVLLILYTSSLYNDRLADDKLVLASLEQYILLNSSELLYGAVDSVIIGPLVKLYGLYRGLAKMSYQIPYSPEAERILFHVVVEKEWDLFSTRIHLTSLKWLFQQEKLYKPLSSQLLKLCRCYSSNGTHIVVHKDNSQHIYTHAIAELVTSGDNFGATLLVCLLRELAESGQEHDIIAVLNTMLIILDISPAASDQLCLHGICGAIQNLYYHSRLSSSHPIFMTILKLIFRMLSSVNSQSLSDDEAWLAVTMKLMDYLISTVAVDGWTEEGLIVVGIFSLILHQSINQALVEASKTILLSTPLVSTINNTVYEACSKGPALVDHDEGTKTGEILIFVVLLHFFSFRSVRGVLPGTLDWQNLVDNCNGKSQMPFMSIPWQELCRLMHFGSPLVKLIASYCLRECFSIISDEKKKNPDELKWNEGDLLSAMAVLEGLVFSSDNRVATNSALCLSMILEWEAFVPRRNNWCRLIVEEFVMSLSVSSLASKSFMIHHGPAVHVAVALLKLHQVPKWMSTVFDNSCMCGIIQNLSAGNVSSEIVLLFRQLLNCRYLKADHVADLNRVFQECRKRMYTDHAQEGSTEEHVEKVVMIPDDLGNVCNFLINLMSSQSPPDIDYKGLLEEIDLFSTSVMEDDHSRLF